MRLCLLGKVNCVLPSVWLASHPSLQGSSVWLGFRCRKIATQDRDARTSQHISLYNDYLRSPHNRLSAQHDFVKGKTYRPEVARGGQRKYVTICPFAIVKVACSSIDARCCIEVKNETNKDGSGKGQWSAWKVVLAPHSPSL